MGYYSHGVVNGLGASIDDILKHVRKTSQIEDEQERKIAPYVQQMFALQTSATQAQLQHSLEQTNLEQRAAQTTQLMRYLPFVLGGVGILGAAVLLIRVRRKR